MKKIRQRETMFNWWKEWKNECIQNRYNDSINNNIALNKIINDNKVITDIFFWDNTWKNKLKAD